MVCYSKVSSCLVVALLAVLFVGLPAIEAAKASKLYVRWCDVDYGVMCFEFVNAYTGRWDDACYNIKPDGITRFNEGMPFDASYTVYWYRQVSGKAPQLKALNKAPYKDGYEAWFNCPDDRRRMLLGADSLKNAEAGPGSKGGPDVNSRMLP